jgi:tetratricopeptide (TPR) repeat protein
LVEDLTPGNKFLCDIVRVAVEVDMPRLTRLLMLLSPLCLVSLTALSTKAFSIQQPTVPDYAKEAFVVNSTATHLRFSADGTSVRTHTSSLQILSEAGVKVWSVLQFPYASENEHVEIHYVRVQKPDGTTVITPPANVLELPSEVTRAAPMYSDLKQKQVPVKALAVGDTLEFEVSYIEDKPLVAGQFWYSDNFSRGFVVLRETLEIRFPKDKHPKVESPEIKPLITQAGTDEIYTWTTAHTAPTKSDTAETADNADSAPGSEDKKPSVQISTFTTWQQVGDWYIKLAQPQAKVTPEIQAKADSLVKAIPPGSTPAQTDALIQAIYNFVSLHIHYIGLSFGVGRYQPHTAAEVLENGYGDCKDKHTLLAALLKAEGIEAWPVLIDSSRKLDEDIPAPSQFDHLITILPQGKQYLWLDSTPEVSPFGMLLSNLRDKQALVVPGSSATAFLLKTPANPPFTPQDTLVMRGSLNDSGTFQGHGDLTLRGDSEVVYRSIFHASARAKWQDVMQQISFGLGFGGDVSNVQIDDPDQTDKPLHLAWDYQRKKYGDWDNRQITPPTGGIPLPVIREDKKPKSAIQLGSPTTTYFTGELILPPGSSMEPPENVDLKTTFAEYHAKYSVLNGKYLTERKLTVLQKEVPVSDWEKYVAFQKEVNADYNRFSSISSVGSASPAQTSTSHDVGEAADLIQSAMQSCQAQELIQCEDQLDKARKLNPHQTNLNASYGSLYLGQGKTEQGMEAFRAELKEHPENYRVARWFAQMLVRTHRDEDALDVYRALLKSLPDDVDANSETARLLVAKENWKEAQTVLDKAIELRPDNAQVQLWYGLSCVHNGMEDKGIDALNSAAAQTSDLATIATIAAALADTTKGAAHATVLAQSAVTLIEHQTETIALDSITAAQLKLMTELAQAWSSMGLTAMKAGDLATGEKYARAAWLLTQDPIAGDRLAQIYNKQGKLAAALETEKLAKARPYPVIPDIEARIDSLEKRLGHSDARTEYDAGKLQDLRIIHLPREKPVSASGDFLVLFTNGKATDVKMIGGDPRIAPYAATLKTAKIEAVFPDNGPERIVRHGILSCSVYDTRCMFMLSLPGDATIYSRNLSYTGQSTGNQQVKTIKLDPPQ